MYEIYAKFHLRHQFGGRFIFAIDKIEAKQGVNKYSLRLVQMSQSSCPQSAIKYTKEIQ